MDDFCVFKLELSNENDIPDIPDIPDNSPNVKDLYYVSDMLPVKYKRYKMKQKEEQPLNIITSASPISSSPLMLNINNYFKNKNIEILKTILRNIKK